MLRGGAKPRILRLAQLLHERKDVAVAPQCVRGEERIHLRERSDDCTGTSAIAQTANELFEDGILVVAAAGNNGSSGTAWNTNTPADAISVFSVNAYGDSESSSESDVRTGDICDSGSSLGRDLTSPTTTTTVSATAYGPRSSVLARNDDDDGYAGVGCWTSYATPTVISSMVAFADFYNQEVSSLVLSDPGYMHATTLLMGDRQARTGGKLTSKFDPRWGAGRLKMRKLNAEGLDGPWAWQVFSTCIDDGETYDLDLNFGNAVSADVDAVKIAAYWYDKNQDQGTFLDRIWMLLLRDGVGVEASIDNYDNKQRIFHPAGQQGTYTLRLGGIDVRSDDSVCGSNSQLVYVAYFLEDSDRDDGDGPDTSVDPE